MSAFLVTKRHINALVTGLGRFGLIGDEPARIVGHDLWRENLRSVRYRYPHHDNKHAVDGYDFTFVNVNTAQLYKCVQCYVCQACEHPGWETSRAKELMDRLETILGSKVQPYSDAYLTAAWGLT